MSKIGMVAVLAGILLSSQAFAGHRYEDDWRKHHGKPRAKHVVVHHVYDAPQVVYRDRIVYQDRPVYVEPVRYAPRPTVVHAAPGTDRLVGQVVGAVAGGVIGNQIGKGSGRTVATAAGAVIGSVVGGHMASGY